MDDYRLSIRFDQKNHNHHLWNNNGTWWCHYTIHYGACKERKRVSLGTDDLQWARQKRDRILFKDGYSSPFAYSGLNRPPIPE